MIDSGYLQGRKVFGQLVCSFRYGREDDEMMGLSFQKDLFLATGQIYPAQDVTPTKLQGNSSVIFIYLPLIHELFSYIYLANGQIYPQQEVTPTKLQGNSGVHEFS